MANRVVTCSDVRASLSDILDSKPHHLGCFFVAFLKFPPIVQSGSILFRKLDREEAGLGGGSAPVCVSLAEVLMCGQ